MFIPIRGLFQALKKCLKIIQKTVGLKFTFADSSHVEFSFQNRGFGKVPPISILESSTFLLVNI